MAMLEYENQLFLDAYHEDGLLVMASGLGIHRLFVNFIKVFCDSNNLVLVLNTSNKDEEYFMEILEQVDTKPMPKIITSDYLSQEREKLYFEGGVLFITSRILVVDMLTNRIPIHLISGILVYKSHKVLESCLEAFILRLYRQKNKTGFIKAFTDKPTSFTAGFCHVQHVMKSLYLSKLILFPRFQASVSAHMDKYKIDVIEYQVHMTKLMTACQNHILDLIGACLKELHLANSFLDQNDFTVEYAITHDFDKIIKLHLDPIWHQLGVRSKQILSDMKLLRNLLIYLTEYDCVSFCDILTSIRTNKRTFGENSGWLFTDAADALFINSKLRIFGDEKTYKKDKDSKECNSINFEISPKWKALQSVLDEIEEQNSALGDDVLPGKVLIVTSNDRTCIQLREFLCDGGVSLLKRYYEKFQQNKNGPKIFTKPFNKGNDMKSNKKDNEGSLTLTQMVEKESESDISNLGLNDTNFELMTSPFTVMHSLYGNYDSNALVRVLNEVQPRYVILYDMNMSAIRTLEVFKASNSKKAFRVYVLMYTSSIEEQRYLTTLRREKEAFEHLINEKTNMVIPINRDGKEDFNEEIDESTESLNTRKGGLQQCDNVKGKIIVDMREFRSELPSLIHKSGINIEPVTLEVGDYILTPDICVERKSLNDLIGSLNSGRLYNQAVQMCRHYKRPVLLIEFDADKSFALQGKYSLTDEINSKDVSSRLTLLTLHFPRLKILWCQSPYSTAEIFKELKLGQPEPDIKSAKAITSETDSELILSKYNVSPKNVLLKIPGVTEKNCFSIMNNVESIKSLCNLSKDNISDILKNSVDAHLVFTFLHHEEKQINIDANSIKNKNSGTRRPNFKGVKRKITK